ncbi:carbohydrate ABC transporter permease [Candidatus Solirubrobacter pratensis]|uniref:carbohydrate ABC transporter permease n=1 Tax=Candidatus Solirubrobacter pratensis TaxID=1298857 RepID=UPI000407BB97|nr:carbohydrate ABC transporter permease [Candidatus Solirubrobacter pratensis]
MSATTVSGARARRLARRRPRSATAQARIDDVWTYVGMVAVLLFFGLPLLWLVSLSFRNASEILVSTINPVPKNPTLDNYREVLRSAQFPRFLLNSAILSAIGACGAIAVAAPAAYAFSRMRFRGRRMVLVGVLSLQMVSPLVLAFPLYRYFASLGLLNSLPATGLVYIAVLMPLATWMLKGFFDAIPKELDDAALIDGASRRRAFTAVVLPIALPGLTAVFVITALLAWAEFVIPFILLTGPSHLPISVGILNFQGTYATNATGILAAGSVIAVLPAILLFIVLQRFIVGAFIAGALKG